MSEHEINLVPKSVRARVAAGRASRRVTAAACVLGGGL